MKKIKKSLIIFCFICACFFIAEAVTTPSQIDLQREYDKGFGDGLKVDQRKNLPSPGIEKIKRPSANLKIKQRG
jgi:hypothetical protein